MSGALSRRTLSASTTAILVAACGSGSAVKTVPAPTATDGRMEAGTQVIPTRYVTDRFFGVPVTPRGDTLTLLLDTADDSRIFVDHAARLGMAVDSVQTTRGYRRATALPAFQPGHSVPDAIASPPYGTRIFLTPPLDPFDTLMSTHTIGQLGHRWFAGRTWTFDYPHHRLLLHQEMPAAPDSARRVRFDFQTDTAGRPFNQVPRLGVEVDGDSLLLLFDTGATMWLTDAARNILHDGRPIERSWSLVHLSVFNKWRSRHPDWRVVEHADQVGKSDIIQVPSIRIAGFDVGPVWFGTFPDSKSTTPIPDRVRIDGTLGGDALTRFIVTLDYPSKTAQFVLGDRR